MKVTTSEQGSELGTRVRRRSVYRAKAMYRADTSDMPIPYEAKGMFYNSRLVRVTSLGLCHLNVVITTTVSIRTRTIRGHWFGSGHGYRSQNKNRKDDLNENYQI